MEKNYDRLLKATNFVKENGNGKFYYTWTDDDGNNHIYDIVFDFNITKIANVEDVGLPMYAHINSTPGYGFDPSVKCLENTFDVLDDNDPRMKATVFKNDDDAAYTGKHKNVFVRKSFQDKIITYPENGNIVQADVVGDAHEILAHLGSQGFLLNGTAQGGHTLAEGDITTASLGNSGENVSVYTLKDMLQQVGLSQGSIGFKLAKDQSAPQSEYSETGKRPSNFENGTVDKR